MLVLKVNRKRRAGDVDHPIILSPTQHATLQSFKVCVFTINVFMSLVRMISNRPRRNTIDEAYIIPASHLRRTQPDRYILSLCT
jgi:hypothetical protein